MTAAGVPVVVMGDGTLRGDVWPPLLCPFGTHVPERRPGEAFARCACTRGHDGR